MVVYFATDLEVNGISVGKFILVTTERSFITQTQYSVMCNHVEIFVVKNKFMVYQSLGNELPHLGSGHQTPCGIHASYIGVAHS